MSQTELKGITNPMVCGGCGATVEFSIVWAIRHWESFGREERHRAFNCIGKDGSTEYHVRLTIGGQVPK